MKHLKFWFIFIMTLIAVLICFLIMDSLLAGVIAGLFAIWCSTEVVIEIFKWIMIVLFVLQVIFTIPFIAKTIKNGDDISGT